MTNHMMTKSVVFRGKTLSKQTPCDCAVGHDHLEATPKELEAALQDLERANGEPVKSRFSHLRPGSNEGEDQ